MKEGGKGGGNTITGLNFEEERNILKIFDQTPGYKVVDADIGYSVLYKGKEVAKSYRKHDLYRYLQSRNIDYKKHISKKLLPDEALYVITENTLFIIEMKFQKVNGSVDEKLQTCDYKKKQYKKLFAPLNIDVEYIYILNDWFKQSKYKDTLDYVISVGCQYYFHYLPLKKLGLPVPNSTK